MSLTTAPAETASSEKLGSTSVIPPLPRQRSRRVLFLAIALTGLGAMLAWLAFNTVNKQVPVVIATKDVPIGTVLSAGDLSTALASSDSQAQTIPGAQLKQLVGTVAATDLRKGAMLVPSQVTTALRPGPGQALVTVALKPAQLPARGLKSGDRVQVTATPGSGGQGENTGEKPVLLQPVTATVDRMGTVGAQSTIVVDLIVDTSAAISVSQQASTGKFALIMLPRGA